MLRILRFSILLSILAGRSSFAAEAPIGLLPKHEESQVATQVDSGQILFAWFKVPGAVSYRLTIAQEDSTFSHPRIYETQDTACPAVMKEGLKTWVWGRQYFWKVASQFADSISLESPIYSFTMAEYDTRAPFLHAAGSGSSAGPVSINLQYNVHGFTRHYFEIAEISPGQGFDILLDTIWVTPVPEGSGNYSIPIPTLKPSTNYSFRMFAAEYGDSPERPSRMTGPSQRVNIRTWSMDQDPLDFQTPGVMEEVAIFDPRITVKKPMGADSLVLEISTNGFSDTSYVSEAHPVLHASSKAFVQQPEYQTLVIRTRLEKSASYHWRLRSTYKGQSMAVSPARKILTGKDPQEFAPLLDNPRAGQVLEPKFNQKTQFYWRPMPTGAKPDSFQVRIEDNKPPYSSVIDTVVPSFSRWGTYSSFYPPPGRLVSGRSYRWTVRSSFGGEWWNFAVPSVFTVDTTFCPRMLGIGSTRSWVYDYYRSSRISTRSSPESVFVEFRTQENFQAEDIRRSGETLRFALKRRSDTLLPVVKSGPSKTDTLGYLGCEVSYLDRALSEWKPTVFHHDHMMDGISDLHMEGLEGSPSPFYFPSSMVRLFLDGYLVYAREARHSLKRYLGDTLIHVELELGPNPSENLYFPDFKVKAKYLERIGLVHWEANWPRIGYSGGGARRDRESATLIQRDGTPFDTTMLDQVAANYSKRVDPVFGPRKVHTLRQLMADRTWSRARLYFPNGQLRATFLPGSPVEASKIPAGIYILDVEGFEGRRVYRIAH